MVGCYVWNDPLLFLHGCMRNFWTKNGIATTTTTTTGSRTFVWLNDNTPAKKLSVCQPFSFLPSFFLLPLFSSASFVERKDSCKQSDKVFWYIFFEFWNFVEKWKIERFIFQEGNSFSSLLFFSFYFDFEFHRKVIRRKLKLDKVRVIFELWNTLYFDVHGSQALNRQMCHCVTLYHI